MHEQSTAMRGGDKEMAQQTNIVDLIDSGRLAQVKSRLSSGRKAESGDRIVDRSPGANDRGKPERDFAHVYKEVADSNKSANQAVEQNAEKTTETTKNRENQGTGPVAKPRVPRKPERKVAEENQRAEKAPKSEAKDRGEESPEISVPMQSSDESVEGQGGVAVEASLVIRESLTVLSEILDLDIVNGLEGLQIENPHGGIIEQFSEIVDALTKIAELLSQAAQEGEAVELAGKELSGEEVAEAEKAIRVGVFRMEIAFRMLGVSREVAEGIAGKQNVPLEIGLATAFNPETKSMPAAQVQQAFGELITAREDEIRTLLSRVAKMLTTQESAAEPAKAPLGVMVDRRPQSQQMIGASVFDAQIMRKILKLDTEKGQDHVIQGNIEAAERTAKFDFVKDWSIPFGRTLADLMPAQEQQDLAPVLEAIGKENGMQNLSSMLGNRVTDLLMKNVEQSVMDQLTSKMHHAVRSGLNEVRLVLHPDSLGEVRLKIEIHQEVVFAKINVENAQVKQIVEANLGQLKDALEQHNLSTGGFEVNVNNGSKQDEGDPTQVVYTKGDIDDSTIDTSDGEGEENGRGLGRDTGKRYGTNSVEYFA